MSSIIAANAVASTDAAAPITTEEIQAATTVQPEVAEVSAEAQPESDAQSVTFKCIVPKGTPAGVYPHRLPENFVAHPNFTFVIDDGGVQVAKTTPKLTWKAPAAIDFRTPLSDTQLSATADLPGTYTYSHAEGQYLDAGVHKLSVVFNPSDERNYLPATAEVELEVRKIAPVINWPAPEPGTYGQALTADQLSPVAEIEGAFTLSHAEGTVLDAGTHTLSAVFTPADTDNYTEVRLNVPFVVAPALVKVQLLTVLHHEEVLEGDQEVLSTATFTGLTNGVTVDMLALNTEPAVAVIILRNSNGNFVGDDGFVVPKNFAEFIEARPNVIRDWTHRACMMGRCAELTEDMTSELTLHMLSLPENSIFREKGYTDRIEAFDPNRGREPGANYQQFMAYVNRCLSNAFKSLRKKDGSDPVQWDTSFNTDPEDGGTPQSEDDAMFSRADDVYKESCSYDNFMNGYVLMNEFVTYIRAHDPELIDVLYALVRENRLVDARRSTGLSIQAFSRGRARLEALRECFENPRKPLPRWRKSIGEAPGEMGMEADA